VQSASVKQVSRPVVDKEPPDAEIDPSMPFMPPAARIPPLLATPPEYDVAPPAPVTPPTAMVPPLSVAPPPDRPPSGVCKPMGLEEQAKSKGMRQPRRFILGSLPRHVRGTCPKWDHSRACRASKMRQERGRATRRARNLRTPCPRNHTAMWSQSCPQLFQPSCF